VEGIITLFHARKNAQRGVPLIFAVFSLLLLGVLAVGFMVSTLTEQQSFFNEGIAAAELCAQEANGGHMLPRFESWTQLNANGTCTV
jgi:hypothetical protein